jgi:CheY-like chemotaxis protein
LKNKQYKPTADKYVLLIVKDTGIGMDKKTIEHIFEPFFTTKAMGKGTGLGLASVYGIIKAHGGYIDVKSKKKHGTTFFIYLPATKRKIKKIAKTSDSFIKDTGTVLLIDDEEIIHDVCKDMLKTIGYKVFSSKDGKKALEIYKKNQKNIDIVLLDMIMPNMSGSEVYDRLKQINPDIKVLLSSGYSIDSEATEILNRGCNGFIQKPFNTNELSGKIREILKKK